MRRTQCPRPQKSRYLTRLLSMDVSHQSSLLAWETLAPTPLAQTLDAVQPVVEFIKLFHNVTEIPAGRVTQSLLDVQVCQRSGVLFCASLLDFRQHRSGRFKLVAKTLQHVRYGVFSTAPC
ncbi:unnamed protein product [Ectocarpus sp. 4 AP-2014]